MSVKLRRSEVEDKAEVKVTGVSNISVTLATQKDFLLGRWLEDAVSWGTNDAERKLYEKNARNLITLWGDQNIGLHEYACKQWSGMLSDFYVPRWQQFYTSAITALESNEAFDQKAFDEKMKIWEWHWVNKQQKYPGVITGDAVAVARRVHSAYHLLLMNNGAGYVK